MTVTCTLLVVGGVCLIWGLRNDSIFDFKPGMDLDFYKDFLKTKGFYKFWKRALIACMVPTITTALC